MKGANERAAEIRPSPSVERVKVPFPPPAATRWGETFTVEDVHPV
jgi:hypothetical protein